MRLTATTPVSSYAVPADATALALVHNKETRPLLDQLRTGANAAGRERPAGGTSDAAGTFLVLWTSPTLPQDCTWRIHARVGGVGATQRASYELIQVVTSIAGVVAALGATTSVNPQETAAACDARVTVDAANRVVTVDARDDAAEAMYWTAVVDTFEAPAAP